MCLIKAKNSSKGCKTVCNEAGNEAVTEKKFTSRKKNVAVLFWTGDSKIVIFRSKGLCISKVLLTLKSICICKHENI